ELGRGTGCRSSGLGPLQPDQAEADLCDTARFEVCHILCVAAPVLTDAALFGGVTQPGLGVLRRCLDVVLDEPCVQSGVLDPLAGTLAPVGVVGLLLPVSQHLNCAPGSQQPTHACNQLGHQRIALSAAVAVGVPPR